MWEKDELGADIIPTMGRSNCGSRCIIRAHVKDGKINKISTQTQKEAGERPALSACAKGFHYHETFLSETRLKYPMKRIGKRGEGKFQRISWEEAVEIIAKEWIRIRDTYGVGSRYVSYATGVIALLRGSSLVKRLLALDGGYLDYYNSYSTACVSYTTPYLYGTSMTGSSPSTILDSNLIILWGHNPAETRFDGEWMYYLKKAKEKNIPIVVIDPRQSDTALQLNAKWIPLKPSTDAALMDAMAYVIYTEDRYDKQFVENCCIGFDKDHMPDGIDGKESYVSYLLGEKDGIKKTPQWASEITGVSVSDIEWLARAYGCKKPAALIPGYGVQRHGNGEQATRGGIMLACLTGNVGVSGGWAAGAGYLHRYSMPSMPLINNPYRGSIPTFLWTDGITHGTSMTKLDGLEGVEQLDSNIKMLFNLGGNIIGNQHSDLRKTKRILEDTEQCEFIVCSDLFMTASAKFADILLPATSMFEDENIVVTWEGGDMIGFQNKIVEPIGESRFEYDWLAEVAQHLGLKEAFTEGKTAVQWLEERYERLRAREDELPPYQAFKKSGGYRYQEKQPYVAFKDRKFPTASGKVEIFSMKIHSTEYKNYVPAIPCYVPAVEGPQDEKVEKYPLQLIGWHTKRRCHSIHDKTQPLIGLDPQRLWMNPKDAKVRGISNEELVAVYNQRGTMKIPVKITERIVEGVVALSQGAWYEEDEKGVEIGGSINVLTSQIPTPLAKGNPQHTNLVQVCLFEGNVID